MRAIKIYSFNFKKGTVFSALPAIVHEYLEKENLAVGRFLYCLESIDFSKLPVGQDRNPCARAVKDCPKLGKVKEIPSSKEVQLNDLLSVNNVVEDTGCTEADIAPFFKRFDRTYGMMDVHFFYYDVDFFGRSLPFLRDRSKLNPNLFLVNDEPRMAEQIYGSGINIYRTSLGVVGLELGIDILHEGALFDPEPYFQSMCALLPGAKCRTQLRVFLSDEEKKHIELLNEQAMPVLAECQNYLKERLPSKERQTLSLPKYNIAHVLKKLAKKHGYAYSYTPNGFYELTKRLPRGHFVKLELSSGPSHCDTTLSYKLEGLGFEHYLVTVMETPKNQEELDSWLQYAFTVLSEFEERFSPKLDCLYDETPAWFDQVD